MPIKILVADDNEIVRSALVRMLKADADLAVIGEAATFAETLELVDGLKPELTSGLSRYGYGPER
jgi:two-component system, NarL family, response regulator DevR